jgi:phosphoribosylformimino-5-aminoimidazole carboxamide ribotide isomerase
MRVIGVVDLLAGRAVHAYAGRREAYAPVRDVRGVRSVAGDPVALARSYVDDLGLTELYVADLDAILGGAAQDPLVARLAALGVPIWLDAGVSSVDRARQALAAGARRVVVGLETLVSYEALDAICAAVGGERVALSLDVRNDDPIVAPAASGALAAGGPPERVAARAAEAGVGAVIVLDLARVGTGSGLNLGLIARVRTAVAGLTLLAGGGVRGLTDLQQLADLGCDAALVATALHDGRLGAADIVTVQHHSRSTR